jgi:hypothetical protein
VDGSKKQAAVELIGRCLSSRAIRGGSSAVLVLFQQTAGFCVHANNASRVVVLGVFYWRVSGWLACCDFLIEGRSLYADSVCSYYRQRRSS